MASFNKRFTNRVQGKWAWLLPPYAMILHAGRKSGREFQTPVIGWASRDRFFVVLYYGEDSDWIRNVRAAGHFRIRRLGRTRALTNPRIVASADASELGPLVRMLARPVSSVFVADLS